MFCVSRLGHFQAPRTASNLERFSIMAQVFVVVAAGSVIGFIVRDLGDGAIAGWIIQVRQLRCFLCHPLRET